MTTKTYAQIVAHSTAIRSLATLDECLLASHNAVACGDEQAAIAVQHHAAGAIGSDGDAASETILMVIAANVRIASVVAAAQQLTGTASALPLLDCGYGTVITRDPIENICTLSGIECAMETADADTLRRLHHRTVAIGLYSPTRRDAILSAIDNALGNS